MDRKNLAWNETMQLHELLNLKTVAMTTEKLMEGVVFDQELKGLLEKNVQSAMADIGALQRLVQKTPVMETEVKYAQ